MKFDISLLQSRVARRLFGLFALCAMLPFAAIATASWYETERSAVQAESNRLAIEARAQGMQLVARFNQAQELIDLALQANGADAASIQHELQRHSMFEAVTIVDAPDHRSPALRVAIGADSLDLAIDARMRAALDEGRTILAWPQANGRIETLLVRRAERADRWLLAQVSSEQFWGNDSDRISDAGIAVVRNDGSVLMALPQQLPAALRVALRQPTNERQSASARSTRWQDANGQWSASWREFLFGDRYAGPHIRVVAYRLQASAGAGWSGLKWLLPLIMVLGLVLALWISIRQIRAQLKPLDQLLESTRRIADRDFSNPVQIESRDEFRELGDAFNRMAESLRSEFATLETLAQVDRLLLESQGLESVLDSLMPRLTVLLHAETASLLLIDVDSPQHARVYDFANSADSRSALRRIAIEPEALQQALQAHALLRLDPSEQAGDSCWGWFAGCNAQQHVLLPLHRDGQLVGVLRLGYGRASALSDDLARRAREFADRLAVALASLAHDDQLYKQAHFDGLTGLPNRQRLRQRLQQLLTESATPACGALLYVDLDHFKRVNDSAGHGAGDALLQIVAQRLAACVKSDDMVARLGGDEFAILLHGPDAGASAGGIAERVLASLVQSISIADREHFISASIGITEFPQDGRTLEELLMHADIAMYRAKEAGRNRFENFDVAMHERIAARAEMEDGMHRALRDHQFALHFQPIVACNDLRWLGAEALIRWQTDGQARSPDKFIRVAEESGLIHEIGAWTLEESCRILATWRARGLALGYLSVNVSPRQLSAAGFVSSFAACVERNRLKPADLQLEITESVIAEGQSAERALASLAEMGAGIALDDFGTGYSSLSYLRTYPITAVKIDRSFILDVPGDPDATKLVDTIIAMGRGLNKKVLAEGVETEQQAQFLRSRGCDALQGYLYSRPIPPQQFAMQLQQMGAAHEADLRRA